MIMIIHIYVYYTSNYQIIIDNIYQLDIDNRLIMI